MTQLPAPSARTPITRRQAIAQVGAGLVWAGSSSGALSAGVETDATQLARRYYGDQQTPLRVLLPHGSEANVTPVATAFTAQTGIAIDLIATDTDAVNSELMLDVVLGRGTYDIALPASHGLPDLVVADAVMPLDAYAALTGVENGTGALYAAADTFDGRTYGLQADGDVYLMFYNNAMLQNPDLRARYADTYAEPLGLPQTWEVLDRQMAFFHNPDAGRWGGALFRTPSYCAWEWWVRFHAKGVWPLSPEMTPQIDADAGVLALEEMIRATQHQVPETARMGLFENWERYGRGDIFANIGWGGTQKYLNSSRSAVRGKLRYAATPCLQSGDGAVPVSYFNWGWNYVVSAGSGRPELAYLFCAFATSPRQSTLAVRQVDGFFDPSRAAHYQDPGVIEAYSKPFLKVHRQALTEAIPDLYLKGQSEYFTALAEGLDAALHGQRSAQDALKRVAVKWELITSRSGRAGQIARWAHLRAKYPASLQTKLRHL